MKKKVIKDLSRVHLFYTGRVQGVGFRYTAEEIADNLDLVGWVKNLPDGRVELICEGERENIKRLMTAIKQSSLGAYIQKVTCNWEKPTQEFREFHIEFCF